MSHAAEILIVTNNRNEMEAVLKAFGTTAGSKGAVSNDGNQTYDALGTVTGQRAVPKRTRNSRNELIFTK